MQEASATGAEGEPLLEGITVVALEQAVAAPLGTRHLADLGARVIPSGDQGRSAWARATSGATTTPP